MSNKITQSILGFFVVVLTIIFSLSYNISYVSARNTDFYVYDTFGFGGYIGVYKSGVINQKRKQKEFNLNDYFFSSFSTKIQIPEPFSQKFIYRPQPRQIVLDNTSYYFYSDKFNVYLTKDLADLQEVIPVLFSNPKVSEGLNVTKTINSYVNGEIYDKVFCEVEQYSLCSSQGFESFDYKVKAEGENKVSLDLGIQGQSEAYDLINNFKIPEDFQVCLNSNCLTKSTFTYIEQKDTPLLFVGKNKTIEKRTKIGEANLDLYNYNKLRLNDKYLGSNVSEGEETIYDKLANPLPVAITLEHPSKVKIKLNLDEQVTKVVWNKAYDSLDIIRENCKNSCNSIYSFELIGADK